MQRETLKKRSKGHCEIKISPECTGKYEHSHHRKMRSQGGTDRVENILGLCSHCHAWIHANPNVSYTLGWLVKSHADESRVEWYPFNWYLHLTREEKSGTVTVHEKPRNRQTWSMKVPKDEQENGYEVFTTLFDQVREQVAPVLGLTPTCPPYYILVAVMVDFLAGKGQT